MASISIDTHLLFLLFLVSIPFSISQKPNLAPGYYKQTCPDFEKIVSQLIHEKQMNQPTTAAGTLRTFVHDCFVEGCDASVLIASNAFNKSERDAENNAALPGDAFDIVTRIKTMLEITCPGIVSCADILAEATRDLVVMQGGPFYQVPLGRKDSLVSNVNVVEMNLPGTNTTMDDILKLFESKGFSVKEMVALMGGHTIGFSHCKEFKNRLYSFSPNVPTDPDIHPTFAKSLRELCSNDTDGTMSAFNDVMTPGKFDNMYYKNLPRGLGVLSVDNLLYKDPRTKVFVELYAANQTAFFEEFARSMEKLNVLGVKTGNEGEVRRRCDTFNALNA